jgi:hypothetical protein
MASYSIDIPKNSTLKYTGLTKKKIHIKTLDKYLTTLFKNTFIDGDINTHVLETFYLKYYKGLDRTYLNLKMPLLSDFTSFFINSNLTCCLVEEPSSFYKVSKPTLVSNLKTDLDVIFNECTDNPFIEYLEFVNNHIRHTILKYANHLQKTITIVLSDNTWLYKNVRDMNLSVSYNIVATHKDQRIDTFKLTYKLHGIVTKIVPIYDIFKKLIRDDILEFFIKYNPSLDDLTKNAICFGYYFIDIEFVSTRQYYIDDYVNKIYSEYEIYNIITKHIFFTDTKLKDNDDLIEPIYKIPKKTIRSTHHMVFKRALRIIPTINHIMNSFSDVIHIQPIIIEPEHRIIKFDIINPINIIVTPITIIDIPITTCTQQLKKITDYSILDHKTYYSKTKAMLKVKAFCKKCVIKPIVRFIPNVQYITPNIDIECIELIPNVIGSVKKWEYPFIICYETIIAYGNKSYIAKLLNRFYTLNVKFCELMQKYTHICILKDIHFDSNKFQKSKHFTAVLYNNANKIASKTSPYHFYISNNSIINITCINSVI